MGEGTSVNMARPAKAVSTQRPLNLGVDVPLLLIVLTLVVFGLLMVYSASESTSVVLKQALGLVVGGIAGLVLARIDYHRLRRIIVLGGVVTWILLVLVLFIGENRYGAVRTLFGGSVQPSELAKPVLIIYLAFWLSSKQEKLGQISFGLVPMGVIIGLTVGLIILQPDFSAALTLVLLGILLFFLAGGKLGQTLIVIGTILVIGYLAVSLQVSNTITKRITEYIAGRSDPLKGPEQVVRSMEGIVKGQLIGDGLGKSDVKFTGLASASRDTIFVVIVQEMGSILASFIILAYMLLCWRGSVIAGRAPDQLGALLAMGLTAWITFEALINIGMVVGLVPVAGNALPFISAGGSNLACSLASIGIVMSVVRGSVATQPAKDQEGRSFSAIVNLRRGDGGRRVSRSRRSSGTR
jgi:cell division protein FtsW